MGLVGCTPAPSVSATPTQDVVEARCPEACGEAGRRCARDCDSIAPGPGGPGSSTGAEMRTACRRDCARETARCRVGCEAGPRERR